jgi:signal transduction histidine kinase
MSITLALSIGVARALLLERMDERIDTRLTKEVAELQLFATNAAPVVQATYREHVRELFRSLLVVDPPGPTESVVTFVDGAPFIAAPEAPPYRLDQDPAAIALWSDLEQPTTGTLATPAGDVEYRAQPMTSGDGSRGVYVVAVFRALEQHDVDQATLAALAVAAAALLVGSILVWTTTGRMLRPVAEVTRTARAITETDLTRRIPVEGDKEIATLAATFNDMLRRLDAAFGSQRAFLNDAGHELRTPITIIRGQLELLEDDPSHRRATLALVVEELDRMGRMVDDLILLAKAQQPDVLRFDTVNVDPFTQDLYSKAARLSDREWTLDAVGRGVIVADPQRLTEAIMQLAENAVKHTSAGVLALGSDVDGQQARFWVRDEGVGIPAAERDRIFERFARAPGRRREGAGLGLAIVRVIAEAHHGSVEVQSQPDRGSTFTVTVPVDQPLPEDRPGGGVG